MSNNSKTSLVSGVFRELGLLVFAVLFGSLPFVAAAQAQENPISVHAWSAKMRETTGQSVTAQAAAKRLS